MLCGTCIFQIKTIFTFFSVVKKGTVRMENKMCTYYTLLMTLENWENGENRLAWPALFKNALLIIWSRFEEAGTGPTQESEDARRIPGASQQHRRKETTSCAGLDSTGLTTCRLCPNLTSQHSAYWREGPRTGVKRHAKGSKCSSCHLTFSPSNKNLHPNSAINW